MYQRLRVQVDELRNRMGGLPALDEAVGVWRSICYEETHHSTAIEGNTLILKQVERLLVERLLEERLLEEGPGSYRRHDIHAFPGGMTPVSWPLIDSELTAWEEDANSLDGDLLLFPEVLAGVHC